MECTKTCVIIFTALIVSTAGFVLTLTGWFAPALNSFVDNVRLAGPVILLAGFIIMIMSCAMCSFVQGRCCFCCYKYSHRKYSLDDAHAHPQPGRSYRRLLLQHGDVQDKPCNGTLQYPGMWENHHISAHHPNIYPQMQGSKDKPYLLRSHRPSSCPGSPNICPGTQESRSETSPNVSERDKQGKLKVSPLSLNPSPLSDMDSPFSYPKSSRSPPRSPTQSAPHSPHSPHSPSLSLSSPPPRYEDQMTEDLWIHHTGCIRREALLTSTPIGTRRSKEFVV